MTPEQAALMNKIKALAGGKKLLLHVGCGAPNPNKVHKAFRGEDWFELRFDIDANAKPHIVGDMTDLSMLPDGAVDGIFSSHNLEHLYPHLVVDTLKGFQRVLSFGGEIIIACPDLETVAAFVAAGKLEEPIYQSPAGPISAIDILYGLRSSMARGNLFMAHRGGFTHRTLAGKLNEAGFCNITMTRSRLDLEARAFKLPPNHAQRRDKVVLKFAESYNPREAVAVTVDRLVELPHPGAMLRGKMADELDVPVAPLV